MYVALGPIEDSASVRLFLNTNGATGLSHSIFRHTPIVVTEKPTDEEFWEFAPTSKATSGAASPAPGRTTSSAPGLRPLRGLTRSSR
jgi:hypothetical protein